PASSFARRDSTLPRSGRVTRSGRNALSCAWRRRLEVPTTAPAGSASSPPPSRVTSASNGSPRSSTAATRKPSGISAGTSFIECTATSARPSCSATSSSLMNSPLPPISNRARSSWRSPRVVMGTSSTPSTDGSRSSRSATWRACQSASPLFRVAIRILMRRLSPAVARLSPADAAPDLREVPPADHQPVAAVRRPAVVEPQHDLDAAVVRAAQGLDLRYRDQRAAMDAHECVGKFLLQRLQGVVQEVLSAAVPRAHVLLVGEEVIHVVDRDAPQLTARAGRNVIAARRAGHPGEHGVAEARRLLQRALEPLAADGFQHVADRARVERLDRIFVIGRREDHGRGLLELVQVACRLDTADSRHADVEQHDVRKELRAELHGLLPVLRFADDGVLAVAFEQLPQARPRRGLVVHDQDVHAAASSNGNSRRTVKRSGRSSTVTPPRTP